MCKWNKWGDTRIDPCMRNAIFVLNKRLGVKTVLSCCGHGKYPMSILIKDKLGIYELFSGVTFPKKKKKFYKRDKKGYYYIPEVIENAK